jgi:hypothetical protein
VRGEHGKRRTLRLPGVEFIDRFLKHVLPEGFKRIRHYGLPAPARKAERLAQARAALDVPPPAPAVVEAVDAFLKRVANIEACAGPRLPGPAARRRRPGAGAARQCRCAGTAAMRTAALLPTCPVWLAGCRMPAAHPGGQATVRTVAVGPEIRRARATETPKQTLARTRQAMPTLAPRPANLTIPITARTRV